MKNIIHNFKHHLDDYECMWNGIEDIYIQQSKSTDTESILFRNEWFLRLCLYKNQ